jgi:hypothetical protein
MENNKPNPAISFFLVSEGQRQTAAACAGSASTSQQPPRARVSEELTGTGTPTQAQQGTTSKKNSEEEGETNLLLSVAIRLLVNIKCYSTLSGFAAPSALPAPSSPLACSSAAHGAMAYGGSPPPGTIVILAPRSGAGAPAQD